MQKEGGEAVKDKYWALMPCLLLILFAFVFSNLFVFSKGIENLQREAVLKGHAEWVADKSGKPQFKWKECK